MPSSPSSSAQAAREAVAARLKEMRLDAGLTGLELAIRCGWHKAKSSRIENAKTAPSDDDIRAWTRVCGAQDQAADLIAASRTAESMYVEWKRKQRTGLRRLQESYVPLYERTGLRPAEVCGMRWADVDLGKATLVIENTRTLMGNKTVVEKDTKSLAGERGLPLPALVREALKGFRATQAAEKLAAGEAYEDSGYVLVDELGRALNGRHLRVRAYKVMAENALRRVRLYDARASCFTYLANDGVPDHLLALWAGHTNVKTTKRWYVKPNVEDLRPAADTWGGLASSPDPLP